MFVKKIIIDNYTSCRFGRMIRNFYMYNFNALIVCIVIEVDVIQYFTFYTCNK